jgi:hypothetical protein
MIGLALMTLLLALMWASDGPGGATSTTGAMDGAEGARGADGPESPPLGASWRWWHGQPMHASILASSQAAAGTARLPVGAPDDDAACAHACSQVPGCDGSGVYALDTALGPSCQCLATGAAAGCVPMDRSAPLAGHAKGVFLAGVPCAPGSAPGDGVALGAYAPSSTGTAAPCDAVRCPPGEWLRGCRGNDAGVCTPRRVCAFNEDCVALLGPSDDCTCVPKAVTAECPEGQGVASASATGCVECAEATAADPYHSYRAPLPLLRHPVHIYMDADDGLPKFRSATYTEAYPDAGALALAPAALWARPLFVPGAQLMVDTARGLVYRAGHYPPDAPRMQGEVHQVGARGALLDAITAYSVVPLVDPPPVPGPGARHLWDATMPAASSTAVELGGLVELPAGPSLGATGQRPLVRFRARGAPFRDCVGCAQGVHVHSLLELGGGVDHSTGSDTGPDASLFDYSAFAWASGSSTPVDGAALAQALALAPIDTAGAMATVLVADLPVGRFVGATFHPASEARTRVAFMNRASPASCLSCRLREQDVCPPGTVLTGCGFRSAGYCATCYRDDANPCGNCQAARLRAVRADGSLWEPDGAATAALAFAPLGRLAAACSATPGGLCAWDANWMVTPVESRLPSGLVGGREWQLKSTVHGAAFPPGCCANGSAAIGGDAGSHCAFALGRPVVAETVKSSGAWRQAVRVDWRARPRVHIAGALALSSGGAALPRPDSWPELVYAAQFYEHDDGTGAAAEVTGLSAPGVLSPIPLAAPPASCLIGPYSALVLASATGNERIFVNTSVVGRFLPLLEVGWGGRAIAYAVHSLESAPPPTAPAGAAVSPWPSAADVGALEDVLQFGPPHRPAQPRLKWTGCHTSNGESRCDLGGDVPWGMHRRDLCGWAECELSGGVAMNVAKNGMRNWQWCDGSGVSIGCYPPEGHSWGLHGNLVAEDNGAVDTELHWSGDSGHNSV